MTPRIPLNESNSECHCGNFTGRNLDGGLLAQTKLQAEI